MQRSGTACGQPAAEHTSGLVAYLEDEPVGWVAVEPRIAYPKLRTLRVPWTGRREDKDDDGVWSVTCFCVRKGYRGRGITYPLAQAAADYAREQGATAVEGYAMVTDARFGDHLGRGPRRSGTDLRGGRLHRGQRADEATAGDADRLLASAYSTESGSGGGLEVAPHRSERELERPAVGQWIIRRRHAAESKCHRFGLELVVGPHDGVVCPADPDRPDEEHHGGEHHPDVVEDLVGRSCRIGRVPRGRR